MGNSFKWEVNYTDDSPAYPDEICRKCVMFIQDPNVGGYGSCTKVIGRIKGVGRCDLFRKGPNASAVEEGD